MEQNLIMQYVILLNNYQNNPVMQLGDNETNLINTVRNLAKTNNDILKLVNQISNTNNQNKRIELVNEAFKKKTKLEETKEENIAKTFDIDQSQIKTHLLKSGEEIFEFYDSKLGRNVFLQNNRKGKSIEEQLEIIKKDNTSNNLDEQLLKEEIELKFIPLEEINNYPYLLDQLTEEDLKRLSFLVQHAGVLNIRMINVENQTALSRYGMLYESYFDSKTEEYKISKTKEIGNEPSEEVKPEILPEEEEVKEIEKPKIKILKNKKINNDGYVDTVFLALTTGFLIGIIASLIMIFVTIY